MSFVANPSRDAGPTIAGFVFQVNMSILRWLDLAPSQHLELEHGEDIDTVDSATDEGDGTERRLLEQLKIRSDHSVTLRTVEALEALSNFCVHKHLNPGTELLFRYLTTASIGLEKGWAGSQAAIATWQSIRDGEYSDEARAGAIELLRLFIAGLSRPSKIHTKSWDRLQAFVAEKESFVQLILGFEWAVGQPGLEQSEAKIRAILVHRGHVTNDDQARFLYEHLLTYVFRLLSRRGRKLLSAAHLAEECSRFPTAAREENLIRLLRAHIEETSARFGAVETTVAKQGGELATLQHAVQALNRSMGLNAAFSISVASFSNEVPEPVHPRVRRSRVVAEAQKKLESFRMAQVVGEPGSGKTQLLLLLRELASLSVQWLNIPRDSTESQACILLDAYIRSLNAQFAEESFRDSLSGASERLRRSLFAIDDLPRILPGGRLATRIEQLAEAIKRAGGQLLISSYYRLPATLADKLGDIHCEVPRFDSTDVVELVQVAGAPMHFQVQEIADLLIAVTQGLPVLAVAAVRFLASQSWRFTLNELEAIFRGDFAEANRRDAQELLHVTVPDARERELIIRMSLAIGPFSGMDVARVAKVPSSIPLPGEIVQRATGVWLQRLGHDQYMCSPLITSRLAETLEPNTRRGVHFILGTRILSRATVTPIDAFAAVNHFILSEITLYAVLVTINILSAYIQLDQAFTDEFGFARLWPKALDRSEVDLNLELHLRSLQIIVAAKIGRDIEPELTLFDSLLAEADYTGWGVAIATAGLAIHLVWKFSALASKYLTYALKAFPSARLPDGSPLPVRDHPIEIMALMSAHTCNSDADVDAWLEMVKGFSKTQLQVLAISELAEDNVVIVCDGVWSRELRKPQEERDWAHVRSKLEQMEAVGRLIDFSLLEAAAIRARITVLAEFEAHIEDAMQVSGQALRSIVDDTGRFLLLEVTGRQLVIADRDEEGRHFLIQALSCDAYKDALLRRNVLVILASLQSATSDDRPTQYTEQALKLSRGGKLIDSILVGTLAEHGIAQWRSGDRAPSLVTFSEAVDLLLKIQQDTDSWKALFYQVFGVLSHYSDVAHNGNPRGGYAVPEQGWFLSGNEDLAKAFRPEQTSYISIRVAMFADGVHDFERAENWTWRGIALAEKYEGARDAVASQAQYALPGSLLRNDFAGAGRIFGLFAKSVLPSINKTGAFSKISDDQKAQLSGFPNSSAAVMSLSKLRVAIPITLRLATQLLKGASREDTAAAISAVQVETEEIPEAGQFASGLRRSLIDEVDWRTLSDESLVAHGEIDYVNAQTLVVGAILKSPAGQALYFQIRLMETLGKLFSSESSLYSAIVAPFFVEYFREQATRTDHPFRTAQTYTLRQLELSDGTVGGTRRMLHAMRFCMGVTLPPDAMVWLDHEESGA
jgi:hypothetical protein